MSDLHGHFVDMGLEIHMFASQWFLTLFTAKFPLHVVFHILDLYLSEVNQAEALKMGSVHGVMVCVCVGELMYFD